MMILDETSARSFSIHFVNGCLRLRLKAALFHVVNRLSCISRLLGILYSEQMSPSFPRAVRRRRKLVIRGRPVCARTCLKRFRQLRRLNFAKIHGRGLTHPFPFRL